MPYLTTRKNLQLQLSPGLVASYDIQPGNGVGLFWDTKKHTHIYLLTFPGATRDFISQLPKLCVKITIFMQGHVLIADWSVAHFVVIMNDVMNDNMAAFAHAGARLGAFFYWTRFLENNVPFDNIPL